MLQTFFIFEIFLGQGWILICQIMKLPILWSAESIILSWNGERKLTISCSTKLQEFGTGIETKHCKIISRFQKTFSPPCRNIFVPKYPCALTSTRRCRNVHVPKGPRSQKVCAEMSIAEMSGAEMSQRQIIWLYSEKATKFENISQVYFELLSNDNRNCEIFSYYCGLLGINELYLL